MKELIALSAIILIIGGIIFYIIKAKKRGTKCIGCPYGSECSKKDCNK